jgi:hypothetical protein
VKLARKRQTEACDDEEMMADDVVDAAACGFYGVLIGAGN